MYRYQYRISSCLTQLFFIYLGAPYFVKRYKPAKSHTIEFLNSNRLVHHDNCGIVKKVALPRTICQKIRQNAQKWLHQNVQNRSFTRRVKYHEERKLCFKL